MLMIKNYFIQNLFDLDSYVLQNENLKHNVYYHDLVSKSNDKFNLIINNSLFFVKGVNNG
jgi:hypothetical protein